MAEFPPRASGLPTVIDGGNWDAAINLTPRYYRAADNFHLNELGMGICAALAVEEMLAACDSSWLPKTGRV